MKSAQELIAEASMGMLDVLNEDMPEEANPVACLLLFAYDVPDAPGSDTGMGPIRYYCTDASWWHQLGLLQGALKTHERATFEEKDE